MMARSDKGSSSQQNELLRAELVTAGCRNKAVDTARHWRVGPAIEPCRVGSGVNAAGTSNLTRRGSDEFKNGRSNTQLLHNILMAWCLVYRLRPSGYYMYRQA